MIRFLFCILFIVFSSPVYSQSEVTADSLENESEDPEETAIRENPVIDWDDDDFDISVPPFIKSSQNRIDFNGADWTPLRKALANASVNPVSIIHIGDSHIQADFATSEVRDNLQFDYGNAGRGLITPLRISGTNQPVDYGFSSTQSWDAVKFMRPNWPRTMGFTGSSITPASHNSNLLISTAEKEDYNPFTSLTVFHGGQFYVTAVTDPDGNQLPFIATPSKDYTYIELTENTNAVRIYFDSAGDLTVYGVSLSGNRPGIFYHTIGNNGATFTTYNRIGNMGQGLSSLQPDLVIVSLGTNEAFGSVSRRLIWDQIDKMVKNIKSANPSTAILLVTPMECQRITYSTVRVSGKKRRKRKFRKVKGYKINDNIQIVRDAILDYADNNHIAVYDWYEIAGGRNASSKWISDGLFSGDRVHLSHKGYRVQGLLLYQALRSAFEQ